MLRISDNLEKGLLVAMDCSGARALSGSGSISGTSRSWDGAENVGQTDERAVGQNTGLNIWQAQMSPFAVATRGKEKLAPMAATVHAKVVAMKPHMGPAAGKQDPGG